MIKLVIFDFDGVIITGSNEGYFRCYHKALEKVSVRLEPAEERERILGIWGKGYKPQLEYLLKEHPNLLPKAIKAYESCYYSPIFSKDIRLVSGAYEVLRKLSEEYTLVIVSGMMRKTLDGLLKQFKLAGFFKAVFSSDEIINPDDKKPAPFMLNKVVNELSISKEETVYIGDASSDIAMANNAGITPIVVLTGHLTKTEAEDLKVKYVISDITYLKPILTAI